MPLISCDLKPRLQIQQHPKLFNHHKLEGRASTATQRTNTTPYDILFITKVNGESELIMAHTAPNGSEAWYICRAR